MIIYESRFLTTNANLYLYGTAANLTSSYTFIRKQDINDSVIWTKILTISQTTYHGFDVAQAEDYLYFIPLTDPISLNILNATDGRFVNSKIMSGYQVDQIYVTISVSTDIGI